MAKYDYDIGIIGGGAAGLTTAAGAAQLGAKTLLVERAPQLGGDCLHYGCVPSKTLIKTAAVYHSMSKTEFYGLPKVSPPPVDYSHVAARISDVINHIQVHDSVERFEGFGCHVRFGNATFRDEHSLDIDGQSYSAKKWLIATGSSPFIPSFVGAEYCITNENIFSLQVLPSHLVILGAGAIAVEMAQSFARLGSQVTIVQRSDQILSKEDVDMATIVHDVLASEGVRIRLGSQVERIEKDGEGRYRVCIVNGAGESSQLNASHVLAAYGRRPNIEGLGLESIGVETGRKGVVVDDRLRTSQPNIFGAGDVVGKHLFTHAAGYEGGVVLTNAILRLPRKVDYTLMPRCTYVQPEFACIGVSEKEAREQGLSYTTLQEGFAGNDRAQAEGEVAGKIKIVLNAKGKPIGVQIVGAHAGELLSQWISFLGSGKGLSQLAGGIHPYPTFSEINKRVVSTHLGTKLFSPRVRKILRFFFQYRGEK